MNIRKIALTALAALLLLPLKGGGMSARDKLSAYFHESMQEAMKNHQLPNAGIAVVMGDEIILLQGYGYADLESMRSVDPEEHLFRSGSVSKVFTWTAVMQLAEKGMVDLDADINQYLDFDIPDRLYKAGKEETTGPITLKHLMTHTSGFEDVLEGLFLLDPDKHPGLREYLLEKIPERIYPAGRVMAYSNYGPALAGYIIERVSGKGFETYMRDHVFNPLGMESSNFSQPLPESLNNRLVQAYRKAGEDFLPGRFEYMPAPAGGLSTTAADMARFMLAHLNGGMVEGQSILEPVTVRRMHSKLFVHHYLLGGMAHGFKETIFNGQHVLFHGGSTNLFDSGLYMLPDSKIGIFITCSGGSFQTHMEIFHDFMNQFFPAQPVFLPEMPRGQAVSQAKALQGEYQQSRRVETSTDKLLNILTGVMRVRADKDGQLLVTHLGKTYRFAEEEPWVYRNLDPGPANPFGTFNYLIKGEDPKGRTMLMSDGPMTYIRMPWYARGGTTASILIGSLLISLAVLLIRLGAWIAGRLRKSGKVNSPQLRAARWLSTLHAGLLILMLAMLAGTGMPHPVYQLPLSAFGEYNMVNSLLGFMPYLLTLLGAMLLLVAVQASGQGAWRPGTRLLLGIQAFFGVGLIWLFWFYHMFSW
jgi:CubicO group peptidase (beta-lactamase class C family)